MTTHDYDDTTPLDATLRLQLRALRRDQPPAGDLWPGIAARLAPRETRPAVVQSRRRWVVPTALAASLLLVTATVATLQVQRAPPPAESLVQREADGLEREYHAALRAMAPDPMALPTALPTAPPAALPAQADLDELDRSAALIHAALAQDPDSRLLLDRLRRTYARRLALTQRLAHA